MALTANTKLGLAFTGLPSSRAAIQPGRRWKLRDGADSEPSELLLMLTADASRISTRSGNQGLSYNRARDNELGALVLQSLSES